MANCAEPERRWRDHLKWLSASGLSREAYCAWHGLSRSTFYRWERRLRGQLVPPRALAAFDEMQWIAVRLPPDSDVSSQSALRSVGGC